MVQTPGATGVVVIEYTLRSLVESDESVLWEMLYHAIYVPPGASPPPRDIVQRPELARYVRGWGRPTDLGVLAIDGATGEPLGAAWLRLLVDDNRGYGYVDDNTPELSIAVLPACRGAGLGTAMLRRLLDIATARYDAISLSVSSGNPAIRMYERFGFTTIEPSGESHIMRLEFRH